MTATKNSEDKPDDVEFILDDIGGTFGRFQILNYVLFAVPIFLSSVYVLDYVFSSLDLDYRCLIPECETAANTEYQPYWLENAVPFKNSKPVRCMRYEAIPVSDTQSKFDSCEATAFNQSSVIECSSGVFVYRTDEVSVVNEFNITCESTNWKLSLIGVTNNVARLTFLPIFGHISDRIGHVPVLIMCACAVSILKFSSSFSVTYEMFVIMTFFDAGFTSAIYPTSTILGLEWASAEKRILVLTIIMTLSPVGTIVTAFIASQTHHFKWMLRIISLPGLLLIAYIWLARESLRWLLVKKKYDRAIEVVMRASKMNKIEPSQRTFDIIAAKCKSTESADAATADDENNVSLRNILASKQLAFRFLICILGWIGMIFVLYGMSITSVSLPGDKYWNFSIVELSAGPAVILSYFTLTYLGRKWSMCSSMVPSGTLILSSNYAGQMPTLALVLFFLSKLFAWHSLQAIYVYTTELWPTNLRHTILGTCSTFGRIGSILAPMIPLLGQYSKSLPYFLFFGTSTVVGFLFLLLPETFNTKLPDTIEEAKSIGKVSKNKSIS